MSRYTNQALRPAAMMDNPTARNMWTLFIPTPFSSPPKLVEEVVEALVEDALVVSAGASQCQWSLWGSQPIDSVGLGIVGETAVDVVTSDSVAADVTTDKEVNAEPSQCL